MSTHYVSTVLAVSTALILLFPMTGYASDKVDLVATKVVTIMNEESQTPFVAEVMVHQEGDEVVIHGKVANPAPSYGASAGTHVYVTMRNADGNILKEDRIPYHKEMGRLSKKRDSFFSARYKMVLPKGSTISFVHHSSAHHDHGKNVQ